jgi:hypothetical protein
MPSGTVEVLIDLLEEQEDAIRAIAVHLSTGDDLSASQVEAMSRLRRKSDETYECIEAMIRAQSNSDSFANAG